MHQWNSPVLQCPMEEDSTGYWRYSQSPLHIIICSHHKETYKIWAMSGIWLILSLLIFTWKSAAKFEVNRWTNSYAWKHVTLFVCCLSFPVPADRNNTWLVIQSSMKFYLFYFRLSAYHKSQHTKFCRHMLIL